MAMNMIPTSLLDTWNTLLDGLFYDLAALSTEERGWLATNHLPEGTLMDVMPAKAGNMGLDTIKQLGSLPLLGERFESSPLVVAVPGVGSSAVGAAAFARNVADHLEQPVVAVVAGNGGADVVADALGGWLVLEAHNSLRMFGDQLARRDGAIGRAGELSQNGAKHTEAGIAQYGAELPGRGYARLMSSLSRATAGKVVLPRTEAFDDEGTTSEINVLRALLTDSRYPARLVVAHSKGAYSLATALYQLRGDDRLLHGVSANLQVITLGAVVEFPEGTPSVKQLLGAWDGFGWLNSSQALLGCAAHLGTSPPFTWVPGASHSLSRFMPGALSVAASLEIAGVLAGPRLI